MNVVKKLISFILTAMMIESISIVAEVSAYQENIVPAQTQQHTVESGDKTIYDEYKTYDDVTYGIIWGSEYYIEHAAVTGYVGNKTNIEILSQIDGISVTYIDAGFENCTNIQTVKLPSSITSIGSLAFSGCSSLKKVVMSENIRYIGSDAFDGCSGLENIDIPQKTEYIGDQAFRGCSSLKEINIPEGTDYLGKQVFFNCKNLKNINVDKNNDEYCSEDGVLFNKSKTELICCPGGASGTFTITNNITKINDDAFSGYKNLKNIEVSENNNQYSSEDGVLFNKEKTTICVYPAGKTSESYTIPDGIEIVGSYAFSGCSDLKEVIIPTSVTYIGSDSFYDCDGLTSIEIPENVTAFGYFSFMDCDGLSKIQIPVGVKTLDYGLFSGCRNLRSVEIPDTVTQIGWYVFFDCDNLKDIYYSGSEEEWNKISVQDYGNKALKTAKIHYNYSGGILGDVSGDGEVTIADALIVSRYDVGLTELDDSQLAVGDVNGDGSVTIADALIISRYDVGLIDSL